MTVGIYIRVSTQEQALEGYSIPAQKERLKAYCVAQGWSDFKFYIDDGVSARSMDRPKLQMLLDDVKKGKINIVLVYRLDRFTRRVKDLHKMLEILNKHNCGFKSATEVYDTTTAMGRLFITIVAALAEWESDNSSERIQMALEEKVSGGERVGGIPYPFDLGEDEKLIKNERRSKITLDMIERFESGQSAKAIADYLTLTNRDKPEWFANTVIRIFRNPALYGSTRWRDKVYENTHKGIITKERFLKLQTMLDEQTIHKRRDVKGVYLFQGKISCFGCGNPLSVQRFIRKRKDGSEYVGVLYDCQRCDINNKSPSEQRFLSALYLYMKNITFDEMEIPEEEDESVQLKEQLQEIEKKREKYQRAWASDLMSDEEFEKLMNETRIIYDGLKRKLAEHRSPATIDIEMLKKIVMTFNENFKTLSREEQRSFISSFIKRIEYRLIPQPPKRPDKAKKGKDLIVITSVEFY